MKARVGLSALLGLLPPMAHAFGDSIHGSGFDPDSGFTVVHMPEPNDAVACNGRANASAVIDRVFLAQTHLLEPSHPFFHLAAYRPVLVKANVVGSGTAPEVRVTAHSGATVIGSLCLGGPTTLQASVDPGSHSRANSFTATLPSGWVRPGLQLTIQAGSASRTYDAATLGVGPAPVLTLYALDMLMFGDTTPTPRPANWAQHYLSTIGVSALQVSNMTAFNSAWMPIEPRGDGRDGFGVSGPQPAMIATTKPSCTAQQAAAGTCTRYSGFALLNSVRGVINALRIANNAQTYSQIYGIMPNNTHLGGGLAGGGVGSGDDLGLFFNHEMGHAQDMPHWGGDWYGRRPATANPLHPYSGQFGTLPAEPSGGGFGNSWAYDMVGDHFINPICADTGKERQEPMQRADSSCLVGSNPYDYFSDYSSLFLHRFFVGATQNLTGTIPYPRDPLGNAAAVPYAYPAKGGLVMIERPNGPNARLIKWSSSSSAYVEQVPPTVSANYVKHTLPQTYNTKVVSFWGSFSVTTPEATKIGNPLRYVGNLRKTWDPTNAVDFADIKSWIDGYAFWYGADLVLRVNYTDGSNRMAVMKYAPRSTDPLNGGSFAYWAVSLPDDRTIASVVLFHRPMEVRNPGDTDRPYNINRTGDTTTAENYLQSATTAAIWVP